MKMPLTDDVRLEFPFYRFYNDDICYLDNAATSMCCDYAFTESNLSNIQYHANPFRGTYPLSEQATDQYEASRKAVAEFIGAEPEEIIFTRNATESLNLAAWMLKKIYPDADALISETCHHSAVFPFLWLDLRNECASYIRPDVLDGSLGYCSVAKEITTHPAAKFLVIDHVSNVLGNTNSLKEITKFAHDNGLLVVADGAQSVPHMPVDVKDLDVDFLAFSGHKMCAPMGIGVLYGKKHILNMSLPMFTGGGMVADYKAMNDITWERPPYRFEAGTPNASGAAALAGACRMYKKYGFDQIMKRERILTNKLVNGLNAIDKVCILGSPCPRDHLSVVSFTVDGYEPNEIGKLLGEKNICVRTGYHCARPLHILMNEGKPSCRASVMFYNTEDEIELFLKTLKEII